MIGKKRIAYKIVSLKVFKLIIITGKNYENFYKFT